MPLNANEEALLGELPPDFHNNGHQRVDRTPPERKKIGKWTIMGLVLNRTIGSGIFLTPHRVLAGTGCVGGALFCWVFGALVSLCGLYVWLECGLSMPQRKIHGESGGEPRGVPRSGGEKNFLEFMFPNTKLRLPHIRTTCSFAIMFVLMYNLSGNAISLGIQIQAASGIYTYDPIHPEIAPDRGVAIGIAIGALTFVILMHMFSRRGGILINNAFAMIKVALLLTIICLGISRSAGRFGGPGGVIRKNFTKGVFETRRTDSASWSNSLMFCMYSFSGYEQPFYILAEAKSPRKYFPKYTVLAMIITTILFLLVNISFLLVVDVEKVIPPKGAIPLGRDMATLFFDQLFDDREKASRAMAALIALSIFGNLVVMTFTAARVKQEIAKEGILPWSLFFATSYITPYGLWKKWRSRAEHPDREIERAPTAAFCLHWFSSVLLILVTIPISDPRKTYSALVSLYSYTIIGVLGCWVSFGLLTIKLRKSQWHWQDRRRYRPWLSPLHPVIYGVATAFILVAAFIPSTRGSPYHQSVTGFAWYIVPAIGITAPLWGILWYLGLLAYQLWTGRHLEVTREAYWKKDPDCEGEYVQLAEIIDHTWPITGREDMSHNFTQPQGGEEEEEDTIDHFVMRQRDVVGNDGGRGFGVSGGGPAAGARRLSDSFEPT